MRVAGFGFRAGAGEAALLDALERAGGPAGLDALATHAGKAGAPVLCRLAARLGLPVIGIEGAALTACRTETVSGRIVARYGTGSIAEAAALAAAGTGARLILPRAVSADRSATAAIAEGGAP